MKPLHLAVVGSRDFDDVALLAQVLDRYRAEHPDLVIVSGAAPGADTLAADYARRHELELVEFPADWETRGRAAGPIRNRQIVDAAGEIVAFWDGESRGTRSSIDLAKRKGIPVRVVTPMGREYPY